MHRSLSAVAAVVLVACSSSSDPGPSRTGDALGSSPPAAAPPSAAIPEEATPPPPADAAAPPVYDCDLSHVACEHFAPACPAGQTPAVSGVCYGSCVDIAECGCDPKSETSCPAGWTCDATTKRCAALTTD